VAKKRDTVANAIRAAIQQGNLPVGSKLPPEPELAATHAVGIATVRAALAQLAMEGLIRTEHGSGSYVRSPDELPLLYRLASPRLSQQNRRDNSGMHLSEAAQAGQPADVTTRIRVEFADSDVAAALDVPTGTEVLVRDRVMRIGGVPTQLAVSCYPRTLTRDTAIEQQDTGPGGVLSRLEAAGHTIAGHTEHVTLHRAGPDEAAKLQLPVGSACLRIERTTRSTTGQVLEHNTMTLVDRYVLLYEVAAE
jgi:GntR family transcriptional regulator